MVCQVGIKFANLRVQHWESHCCGYGVYECGLGRSGVHTDWIQAGTMLWWRDTIHGIMNHVIRLPVSVKYQGKNDGQKVYTVQGDVSITLTIGKERGSGGSYAYVELIRMSRIAERSVWFGVVNLEPKPINRFGVVNWSPKTIVGPFYKTEY